MGDEEGASSAELLLEAARRNNPFLLNSIFDALNPSSSKADLINSTIDGVGQTALHLTALHGSYEVLDTLLDQEGVEVDPLDRFDLETPLHKAVRYANGDEVGGAQIVEMLLDAGADPTIRNKSGHKPGELVEGKSKRVRESLRKVETAMVLGNEVVHDREDQGPTGSASDSE